MNHKTRDGGGGAIIAVTILLMITILLFLGGGLLFFVRMQRASLQREVEQAMRAEVQAVTMAEQQRQLAEQQLAQAQKALQQSRVQARQAADANSLVAGDEVRVNQQDPSPKTGLERIGWLANHWQSSEGEASTEENWIAPRGGVMLGVNRSVNSQGRASFEYLRIEAKADDQLSYYASPMGNGETEFASTEIGSQRVVFENPDHDFPQRISYWLDDKQRLHAKIEGEVNGETRQQEWSWSAVR